MDGVGTAQVSVDLLELRAIPATLCWLVLRRGIRRSAFSILPSCPGPWEEFKSEASRYNVENQRSHSCC